MRTLLRCLLLVVAVSVFLSAQKQPAADLIVVNAKIWTVDAHHPTAAALAVIGDKIVAVGSVTDIEAWRGPGTEVIDAGEHLLLPGFNDSHVHFVDGSAQLTNVQLKDAASIDDFSQRIADYAKKLAPGEWVLGGNWDDQGFAEPRLPTRQDIDKLTPNTPVFVTRYDGHMSVANSAALRLAGVTAKTKDVPGGVIVRDKRGEPTGLLKDAAMSYVYKVIPPLSRERLLATIRAGLLYAASVGVTSVQHMNPSYEDVSAYAELASKRELTTRVYAAPMETEWQDQAKIGIRRAFGSSWLRIGALKGYADGSLGSSTAYFFEPFTDDPKNRGLLSDEMQSLPAIRERFIRADAAGLQLCIHAIGDRAISTTLDLFADVLKANGPRDRRLRIEHAQHMAIKDFARFADMDVIASVQPYHAIDDGRWAEKRIGPDRATRTYAFRTFLNDHVRLAFGTDWFVAPLNPMETIYAAVTRATLDGKHPYGWQPQEKLTVAEAVEAYTMGSAYAEFQENVKGSITAGKLADFVILSDDIFTISKETIKDVKVLKTVAGGKVTYSRD
jgi:predicted amidohydrolase YtcJ